jgi:hypothetical protein
VRQRERAPDVLGEVLAFRAWRVEELWGEPPHLASLGDDLWPTGEWMEAECGHCEEPPGERCSCGIYAARDRRHLVGMGYNKGQGVRVIGDVALAGKVIPGSHGFRAARARVVRLYVPFVEWELAVELRSAYGVPVGLDNTLRA